jgi:hypothetical protein
MGLTQFVLVKTLNKPRIKIILPLPQALEKSRIINTTIVLVNMDTLIGILFVR